MQYVCGWHTLPEKFGWYWFFDGNGFPVPVLVNMEKNEPIFVFNARDDKEKYKPCLEHKAIWKLLTDEPIEKTQFTLRDLLSALHKGE